MLCTACWPCRQEAAACQQRAEGCPWCREATGGGAGGPPAPVDEQEARAGREYWCTQPVATGSLRTQLPAELSGLVPPLPARHPPLTGSPAYDVSGPTTAAACPQVRAPLPVVTERLYGDAPYRGPPRRPANPVPQNVVDAFRNFKCVLGAPPLAPVLAVPSDRRLLRVALVLAGICCCRAAG